MLRIPGSRKRDRASSGRQFKMARKRGPFSFSGLPDMLKHAPLPRCVFPFSIRFTRSGLERVAQHDGFATVRTG